MWVPLWSIDVHNLKIYTRHIPLAITGCQLSLPYLESILPLSLFV